MDEYINA